MPNKLYFGDNLHILRKYVKDESVDLIYLDPPFNSNTNYNILFKPSLTRGNRAQIQAFDDTWKWGEETERTYDELIERGGSAAILVDSLKFCLGRSDVMAYIVMMTIRMAELHRVLKPTGSIYLHCDPTASHYLKIVMDTIFGPLQYCNEIIWKRTTSHNDARHKLSDVTDTILFYQKTKDATFKRQFIAYDQSYLYSKYRFSDADGRVYRLSDLRSPSPRPNLIYDYKGYKPHPNGWAYLPTGSREATGSEHGRLRFNEGLRGLTKADSLVA